MNGVSIVETATLERLIDKVEELKSTVTDTLSQLADTKKPYLSAQEVMELTGFGKTWLNANKQDIGFSTVGGALRFKRKDVEEYMNQNYFKAKATRRISK